jgi:hypothetical protein
MSGPWSSWKNFAPSGSKTFTSQTTYILPWGDGAIYMGDRWVSDNLMRSTYIWLPLTISGTNVTMTDRVNWIPDATKLTWSAGPTEAQYEGESATFSGGAKSVSCNSCSNGKAAGYVGGTDKGVITFGNITMTAARAGRNTIRVRYANGDSKQRVVNASVNGVSQKLAFLPTPSGNEPGSSVLICDLKEGTNTISFSTSDNSWGPDVDRLMVPLD